MVTWRNLTLLIVGVTMSRHRLAGTFAFLLLGDESLFMSRPVQINIPNDKIVQFCRKWKVTELALFGSVLREGFRPDSDVDVLVTFSPDAEWGYDHLLDMKEELEAIFGRAVDLVEKRLVEESPNYIRRKHILTNMEKVYVER